jgi:hypothetical protein
MSDFIREVDEEVRHDQFRRFLNAYWAFILVGVIVVLGGVAAWRANDYFRQKQAEAAAARFIEAVRKAPDAASIAELDGLAKDAPAGYRVLARLRAASENARGDAAAGIKAFDAIASDPSVDLDLQDVARWRAAVLAADASSLEEARRRLQPLADANATFRNLARETLAVLALKAADDPAARRWLEAMLADPAALPSTRQRARLLLKLVGPVKPVQPSGETSSPLPGPAVVPAAAAPSIVAPAAPQTPVTAPPTADKPAEPAPSALPPAEPVVPVMPPPAAAAPSAPDPAPAPKP